MDEGRGRGEAQGFIRGDRLLQAGSLCPCIRTQEKKERGLCNPVALACALVPVTTSRATTSSKWVSRPSYTCCCVAHAWRMGSNSGSFRQTERERASLISEYSR